MYDALVCKVTSTCCLSSVTSDSSWWTFLMGLFLMFFARLAYLPEGGGGLSTAGGMGGGGGCGQGGCPYLRVFRVSSKLASAGETQATMRVRLLPPSESCSSLVSLESR